LNDDALPAAHRSFDLIENWLTRGLRWLAMNEKKQSEAFFSFRLIEN
jgi:hypothetical protein